MQKKKYMYAYLIVQLSLKKQLIQVTLFYWIQHTFL